MNERTISVGDPAARPAAVAALSAGECVIVPTDAVYGMAVAADLPAGAIDIAERKGRPHDKPLAVIVADVEQAETLMVLTDRVRRLIAQHWPGALTLVGERTARAAALHLGAADSTIGIRCPDHRWLRSIAGEVGPLAATSANLAGLPPAATAGECRDGFGPDVLIIDGGTLAGSASTVVQVDPFAVLRPGPVTVDSTH